MCPPQWPTITTTTRAAAHPSLLSFQLCSALQVASCFLCSAAQALPSLRRSHTHRYSAARPAVPVTQWVSEQELILAIIHSAALYTRQHLFSWLQCHGMTSTILPLELIHYHMSWCRSSELYLDTVNHSDQDVMMMLGNIYGVVLGFWWLCFNTVKTYWPTVVTVACRSIKFQNS